MGLGGVELACVLTAALLGAGVQASIGFGMNLVLVPVMALAAPEALPATVVLLGMPLALSMVRHERHAVSWRGTSWILLGRVPGTLLGAWVVVAVSRSTLEGCIGIAVLAAVAMSLGAPPVPVRPGTCAAAGVASGVMGTAAGIGGPPLALLYQHHEGPVMRATLAASFLFGTILSVATLAVAGAVELDQVLLAAALVPAVVLGSVTSRRFHAALDRAWLRPALLGFAAVSGVVVLVDGLW